LLNNGKAHSRRQLADSRDLFRFDQPRSAV
jgi:hypothetical protein